jgi:hypothetical protein
VSKVYFRIDKVPVSIGQWRGKSEPINLLAGPGWPGKDRDDVKAGPSACYRKM